MELEADTPQDYAEPKWDTTQKVHDWKTYISERVRAMWGTFTGEQRAALAAQAEAQANREDWS